MLAFFHFLDPLPVAPTPLATLNVFYAEKKK